MKEGCRCGMSVRNRTNNTDITHKPMSPHNTTHCSVIPIKWQRNILRSLLVTFTFVVASTIHQFGLITAFVGAITDTLQGFVLPPLIYAATFAACISKCEKMLLWMMSGLGVVLMITATSQNVGELKRLVLNNINQKD